MSNVLHTWKASEVQPKPPPVCPTCGKRMQYRGSTQGYVHCEWKLLYRAGGWDDAQGKPVKDRRLRSYGSFRS